MKIIIFGLLFSFSACSLAADNATSAADPAAATPTTETQRTRPLFDRSDLLCPDFVKMPGVVYFSERQLSFNNANSALEDLQVLIDDTQTTLDLTALENDLIVLRGTIYRLTLQAQMEKSGKTDPTLLKHFCDFLKAEAVLRR